jgi:hypothetical protein
MSTTIRIAHGFHHPIQYGRISENTDGTKAIFPLSCKTQPNDVQSYPALPAAISAGRKVSVFEVLYQVIGMANRKPFG